MNTRSWSPRRATLFRTAGWLAVTGMIGLALVGPGATTAAATVAVDYATVTGHAPFSSDANQVGYWCSNGTKLDEPGGSSYVLQQSYGKVIVKAGSGQYANTIFGADPHAGQTVWADTNGNSVFDPGGQGGDKQISHIILCDPSETTSTTSSQSSSTTETSDTTTSATTESSSTTSDTTTSDTTETSDTTTSTTTSDTTTSDTTTSDTTTSATTTSDTTTSETTTSDTTTSDTTTSATTESSSTTSDTTTSATTTSATTTSATTTSATTTSATTTATTSTSDTTTSDTTTSETTQATTTATTSTVSTETFPTEPPFPSFPTEPPATPQTAPPSPTETPTGSVLPTQGTPQPSYTGGVEAFTSAPHVTPPPTSTGGATGTPSDGTWRIVLLAMAAILATLLVLTPATARRR